ncbi:MAG TPA: hypothetical protein VE079_08500 [Ensifer sp.]|nr:hypothetical protein [Ensifer sp.]
MKALEHLPSVEMRDVSPGRVLFSLGIVFLLLVGCMAFAAGTIAWVRPNRSGVPDHQVRLGVRLEVDPPRNDRRIEADAARRLDQQGWNSADHTSAHITISRAMTLLAEQGWPADDTVPGPAPEPGRPTP